MREKIYRTVHIYNGHWTSVSYKLFMIAIICLSIIPLTVKGERLEFLLLESFCLFVFIIDYILRWITADLRFNESGIRAFMRYPIRAISVIDLLSIVALAGSVFGWFHAFSAAKALTVFRIVRILRYSRSVKTIMEILKMSRKPLYAVGSLAVGYIIISAIIMFNIEPDSFKTFFDAVYWSTISLTTVGYGDIYPVTAMGRFVAMISSFLGIAIVALPAGIVTAEYLNRLTDSKNDK